MKIILDKCPFMWYIVCMIKINDVIRDPILGDSFRVVSVDNAQAVATSVTSGSLCGFPLHRLVLVGDHPLFTLWVRD